MKRIKTSQLKETVSRDVVRGQMQPDDHRPEAQHLHDKQVPEGVQGQAVGKEARAVWIKGGLEEDKQRYLDLMAYMEEKRKEARELLQEERGRIERARKNEESLALLREIVKFLNQHEGGGGQGD